MRDGGCASPSLSRHPSHSTRWSRGRTEGSRWPSSACESWKPALLTGVACLLSVVTLRQAGAGADPLLTGQALVALYERMFLLSQSFVPAVNALLLGSLMYQSRPVPPAPTHSAHVRGTNAGGKDGPVGIAFDLSRI